MVAAIRRTWRHARSGGALLPVGAALALIFLPNFARLARNTTLAVKNESYVRAAVVMGQPTRRIMLYEILHGEATAAPSSSGPWKANGEEGDLHGPASRTLTPPAPFNLRRRWNHYAVAALGATYNDRLVGVGCNPLGGLHHHL